MRIDLHIDRLVLDEALLQGERPAAIRAAFEQQLARQLAAPGAPAALRGLGTLASLPPLPLAAAAHPREGLGMRIATSLQTGLGIAAGGRHD